MALTNKQALRELYLRDPCRVLASAFWKAGDELHNRQCSYQGGSEGITEFKAWDRDWLHIYWNKSRRLSQGDSETLAQLSSLIIHEDYYPQLPRRNYKTNRAYFRLSHNHRGLVSPPLPGGFYFKAVAPLGEAVAVAAFISRCYRDLRPRPATVASWQKRRVYDGDLWLWLMDKNKQCPAALGIAEWDKDIGEGYLEWIQTLPAYRGKGLGAALVAELLARLRPKADFTTVSGKVANESNPERLYRSCGFTGGDVWRLLHV